MSTNTFDSSAAVIEASSSWADMPATLMVRNFSNNKHGIRKVEALGYTIVSQEAGVDTYTLNTRVPGPIYNTLLLDRQRRAYEPQEAELQAANPPVFASKIPRANVQQAWMLNALYSLGFDAPGPKLLCIGSYHDTACLAVRSRDIHVVGIDPVEGTGYLSDFHDKEQEYFGTFDAVFATSVIEHDPDDAGFMRQAWDFVKPGGVLLLTTDFKPTAAPGDCIAGANERFYTRDMLCKLLNNIGGYTELDQPYWEGDPDFHHANHVYAFATIGVRKNEIS